jgi:hypothetical protein
MKIMKFPEKQFDNIVEKNPLWSSYICFAEAIKGHKIGTRTMHHFFRKLVDKEDYLGANLEKLFPFLDTLIIPLKKISKNE